MIDVTRRDFLRGVSALSACSLTLWAGGCEGCIQQINTEIKNRPTRKNIQDLWNANNADPTIATYRAAVQMMKALPSSNTSSWQFQMNLHLNKCIHHNWLWLPWHRVYLLYFERICRKLTGDQTFALPYWNWNTHPGVPDPFWVKGSPLNDPNRLATQSDQADQAYIGTSVLNTILGETNFETFASNPPVSSDLHDDPNGIQGMLEATPHNNIHGFVGGDMGSFISPLDPVFYTHHCMLDCLWTHWNVDLGNANTNDPSWMNFAINDFFDENGNPVSVEAGITPLFPLLTYQYQPCSFATGQAGMIKLTGKQLEQFLKTGAPSKMTVVQHFEVQQTVAAAINKPVTASIKVQANAFSDAIQNSAKNRVVLTIGGVDTPPKRDFYVRVFVDKPDATANTSIDDPHYAGSFGFFYDENGMKGMATQAAAPGTPPKTGFVVDVTEVLQRLSQAGSLGAEAKITLIPVPYGHRESSGQLTLQRLDLAAVRF